MKAELLNRFNTRRHAKCPKQNAKHSISTARRNTLDTMRGLPRRADIPQMGTCQGASRCSANIRIMPGAAPVWLCARSSRVSARLHPPRNDATVKILDSSL